MIRKILGRIAAVRPFAFAALTLASFTASAFDTPYLTSYDITEFLDIPAADANGIINLGDATVKDAIVEEVLDPEEGAVLVLTPENPSITTAKTRAGLTYTFYEGTMLEGMTPKAAKVGDGNAWTPAITVKGGASGFYSVHVSK